VRAAERIAAGLIPAAAAAAEDDPGADVEAVGDEDRTPGDAVGAEPAPERRPVRPRGAFPQPDVAPGLGECLQTGRARPCFLECRSNVARAHGASSRRLRTRPYHK